MAYEDREYRRSAVEFDSRRTARSPAPPARGQREYDEVDVRIRERERDRDDGLEFLRPRRSDAGQMVLRTRDVEYDRTRDVSPQPPRFREERLVRRAKSVSPPEIEHEHSRTRFVERERVVPARRRSPSPRPVRYVEPPSTEHIRIVEKERERIPSPSPSPPPAPPVVRGPVIEREVITHYTDIDHGVIHARKPSPPPAPRPRPRERETRETDIDISLSKNRTEVDIHRSSSRARSKSRERRSSRYYEDDLIVRRDEEPQGRRRAHSAAPPPRPADDEAEYITSKVDSRGRMGEAWGGATKNWSIVDVPPGTERIRMDGVGGGATDTTWSKYSGVRRTQFIDERDEAPPAPEPPTPTRGADRLTVSVYDREREIEIDKTVDRRIARTPKPPPPKEMWTEITKDLVVREAIEQLGYAYEETDWFFYVMDYLKYDDVLELTELSEEIRRIKRHRARDVRYEREYYDEVDRRYYEQPSRGSGRRDDRVRETEVIYDHRGPARGYR